MANDPEMYKDEERLCQKCKDIKNVNATLQQLACPACQETPDQEDGDGLWIDQGTPTWILRCRSCGLRQVIQIVDKSK